jgi:hypothetical protein
VIREAFHREPAVIQGSERAGRWYWRDALDQQIAAATEMHTVHHQRRGGWCDYARTEITREHPQCRGVYGRVYSWTAPPPEAPIPRPPSPWQADPSHCACGERLIRIPSCGVRTRCERCRMGLPTTSLWTTTPRPIEVPEIEQDAAEFEIAPDAVVTPGPPGPPPAPLPIPPPMWTRPPATPEEDAAYVWAHLAPWYDH